MREVWRRAMDLVDQAFACSSRLPAAEFDLRRQIRRAAIAAPSNIAERQRHGRAQAYQNHVSIALGSVAELETEIEVACRNGLVKRDACGGILTLCDRVSAMLYRLHESLDDAIDRGQGPATSRLRSFLAFLGL